MVWSVLWKIIVRDGSDMIVFRAMSVEEANKVSDTNPLAWRSKHKWFGTEDFVKKRVLDGKFNNSKFKNKYIVLCKYEIVNGIEHFSKCGNRELMLSIRKANNVNIKLISKENLCP